MSMTWMRSANLNLQHTPSERPSECPTATLTVRPSIYQVGVASSCPLDTIEGAETFTHVRIRADKSMTWVGGSGGQQS
jgi:hypothetical protein